MFIKNFLLLFLSLVSISLNAESNSHSHGDRVHSHPLPEEGIKHNHGNGLSGTKLQDKRSDIKNSNSSTVVLVVTKTKKISVPTNKNLTVTEGGIVAVFNQESYKKIGTHIFKNPYKRYTVTINLIDATIYGQAKLHFKYSGNTSSSIKERSVTLNKKTIINCGEKCFIVMTKESIEFLHYKILTNQKEALRLIDTKGYFSELQSLF